MAEHAEHPPGAEATTAHHGPVDHKKHEHAHHDHGGGEVGEEMREAGEAALYEGGDAAGKAVGSPLAIISGLIGLGLGLKPKEQIEKPKKTGTHGDSHGHH